MSEIVFLLSAEIDIQKAYDHYENYQEGRGAVFLRHLDAAFTLEAGMEKDRRRRKELLW